MYLYIELLVIGGSGVVCMCVYVCAFVCVCALPCAYVCLCIYCTWMRWLWISEWDTQEWIQQLSFLTLNFNIVPSCLFLPPHPCSLLCSAFVHHHSGVIDGAVETANVKVCGPWTDSSAWISVAQSKCWELDERERGRRQHFPSHAFSLSRIESYYLTLLLFPQWPNNIVSAILSSLWPHDFTQESVRWKVPLSQRSLVLFIFCFLLGPDVIILYALAAA